MMQAERYAFAGQLALENGMPKTAVKGVPRTPGLAA